jgi:hypothetical protein
MVQFFSFVTEEHQHRGTPTPINPLININCGVLPATAVVNVVAVAIVAVAVVAAAEDTLIVVTLALILFLSPSLP